MDRAVAVDATPEPPIRPASECERTRRGFRLDGTSETPARRSRNRRSTRPESCASALPSTMRKLGYRDRYCSPATRISPVGLNANYAVAVLQKDLSHHAGAATDVGDQVLGLQAAGRLQRMYHIVGVVRAILYVIFGAIGEAGLGVASEVSHWKDDIRWNRQLAFGTWHLAGAPPSAKCQMPSPDDPCRNYYHPAG